MFCRHRLALAAFIALPLVAGIAGIPTPAQGQGLSQPGANPNVRPVPQYGTQPRNPANYAPTAGGAPRQKLPPKPQEPRAPFTLTPQEEARLHQALEQWEKGTGNVERMSATFTKFEYNNVFQDASGNAQVTQRDGELKYEAPDKGLYRIYGDKEGKDPGEYWVCDGKSIFQYAFQSRQLVERRLPAHMQGQAIADGPLPFLFGQTAAKLQRRYFLRLVTPPNVQNQVWIQAFPRAQKDAANFMRAEMILNLPSMQPDAIQIHLPGGNIREVYKFTEMKINGLAFLNAFPKPRLPIGWKPVTEDLGQQPAAPPASRPGTTPGQIQPGNGQVPSARTPGSTRLQ